MRFEIGLDEKEIADIEGVSQPSVSQALSKAIEIVKKEFGDRV